MKWRNYKQGERVTDTVFAWLPLKGDDGFSYWLERVTITSEWNIDWEGIEGWKTVSIGRAENDNAKT